MAAYGKFLSLPNSIEAINQFQTTINSPKKTQKVNTEMAVDLKSEKSPPALDFPPQDLDIEGESAMCGRRSSTSSFRNTIQTTKRSVSLLFEFHKKQEVKTSSFCPLDAKLDDRFLYAKNANGHVKTFYDPANFSVTYETSKRSTRNQLLQISNASGADNVSAKSVRMFGLFRSRKSMSVRKATAKATDVNEHSNSHKKSFKLFNSIAGKQARARNDDSIEMKHQPGPPETPLEQPSQKQPVVGQCNIIINDCDNAAAVEDDPSMLKLMSENELSASTYSLNNAGASSDNNNPVSPMQVNILASLEYLINQSKSSQLNFNTKLAIANIAAAMSPDGNVDSNVINMNPNSDMILQSLLVDLMIPPLAPAAASQFDLNSTASNEAGAELAILYQQPQYLVNNATGGFSLGNGINNKQINDQIMRTCMGYLDYINKKHNKERHIQKVRNKVSGFVLLTLVFLMIIALCLIMVFFLTKTILFNAVIKNMFANKTLFNFHNGTTVVNQYRSAVLLQNLSTPVTTRLDFLSNESQSSPGYFHYSNKTGSAVAAAISGSSHGAVVVDERTAAVFLTRTSHDQQAENRDIINKKLAEFILALYKTIVLKSGERPDYAVIRQTMNSLFIDMFNQLAVRFDLSTISHNSSYVTDIEKFIDDDPEKDSFVGILI
jgi:hypothetical protein